jgi:hypothetical protein
MTTTYEKKLHAMQLDEGLLSLILSEVSSPDQAGLSNREGIGLRFLKFLEHEPEYAREAAAAAGLSQDGRKVAAHKLALEFLGWGCAGGEMSLPVKASVEPSTPVEPPAPVEPAAPDQVLRSTPALQTHPEYRMVFGCKYERPPHELSPREGRIPREKGGEQDAEVPDQ